MNGNATRELAEAILCHREELSAYREQRKTEFEWFRSHLELATKGDLKEMERRIMSAISDYAGRVNTAFDKIATAVDGVVDDIKHLNEKIEELQNTSGAITPEDQALLDAIEASATATATKLEALDAATERPPVAPPA